MGWVLVLDDELADILKKVELNFSRILTGDQPGGAAEEQAGGAASCTGPVHEGQKPAAGTRQAGY